MDKDPQHHQRPSSAHQRRTRTCPFSGGNFASRGSIPSFIFWLLLSLPNSPFLVFAAFIKRIWTLLEFTLGGFLPWIFMYKRFWKLYEFQWAFVTNKLDLPLALEGFGLGTSVRVLSVPYAKQLRPLRVWHGALTIEIILLLPIICKGSFKAIEFLPILCYSAY